MVPSKASVLNYVLIRIMSRQFQILQFHILSQNVSYSSNWNMNQLQNSFLSLAIFFNVLNVLIWWYTMAIFQTLIDNMDEYLFHIARNNLWQFSRKNNMKQWRTYIGMKYTLRSSSESFYCSLECHLKIALLHTKELFQKWYLQGH